jgi:transcriptional regulator GlxA family with amidase domain
MAENEGHVSLRTGVPCAKLPGVAHQAPLRRVVLVAYHGVQMLDVVGPAEVLAGATRILGDGLGYRLVVASPDGRPVSSGSGLRLGADASLPAIELPVDTLLVAGGWGSEQAVQAPELVNGIRRLAAGARRVCSVCSGAFVLAAAGLLHGRTVTTHWSACTELARRHPEVTVEPDRIFVRDGNVFTSAGVTAGMDLALALVEADHGPEVARTVARWMVLFMQRPGGQSQFSERLNLSVTAESPLRALLDLIVAEPAGDHRVSRLAERAALSERHLARLFLEQAGTTPARFVERARVEVARAILERTSMPTGAVSLRAGFGSQETMRRAFLRVLGVAPSNYRARFRATAWQVRGEEGAA